MMNNETTQHPPLTPETMYDIDYYKEAGLYFYLEATQDILPNGRVNVVNHGEMIMLGSYSYLGLIGHPKINAASKAAIDQYGTGTHGVRLLAGSLVIHNELEERIARFKKADEAVAFSSGYVTNLATISSMLRKGDSVISDKLNHASIVDGCILSQAKHVRFRHNDMDHLERRLHAADPHYRKLVIADAVFSMDGDIIDLPSVVKLCKKYDAYLMIDEAHSIGVLGKTGHGIEEHFDLPPDVVDIKMGTLSKTIPSAGGYVAGSSELIKFLKHEARAFIFSAAVPPPSAAAAKAAFDVIEEEPWRVEKVQNNYKGFANRMREAGFDLMQTETAIVPILCGDVEPAVKLANHCQKNGIFVQAVVAPVVAPHLSRLRVCVLASHTEEDLNYCAETMIEGGRALGIIPS